MNQRRKVERKIITVILPFPDSRLNPNRSKGHHWGSTTELRKKARSDAWVVMRMAARGFVMPEGDIELVITFVQPDRRNRDRDNLLSASKPQIDGVADGLGVNDARFNPITICREYGEQPGSTRIEIIIPQKIGDSNELNR